MATVRRQNKISEEKSRIQEINKRRILIASQEIFAKYGYSGATMNKIAANVNMSTQNILYYFNSKKDLYVAVLAWTLETWLEPLSELDPEGEPEVVLSEYIAKKLKMSRKYPAASRLFANEILQGAPFMKDYLQTELRKVVNRKADVIRRWIAVGKLGPSDPYHLIFLIWAGTQHYADFVPQTKALMNVPRLTRQHFKGVEESLCRIILRGVLPRTDW